jgi:16S rRNA (guanine1207-N2)-methyltransferase
MVGMPAEPADHYFTGDPTAIDRRREITARIWGRELTFTTSAGVFSQDGLDKATDVLLRNSTPPAGGTILDLGCGWGPIACAVAAASHSATVWATDTNTRALELTAVNASRLDAPVHVALPDDVPADLVFDEIWSNPPIRIGKQALHELLLRWLPRLAPDGTARLVVGRNLGADSLQRWLVEQGCPTERATSEKGFRILLVRRGQ